MPIASYIHSVHNDDFVRSGDEFTDELTYLLDPIPEVNDHHIVFGEWREHTSGSVMFTGEPYQDGICDCLVRDVMILDFVGTFAYLQARLQNNCGFSDWGVIVYNKQGDGGSTIPCGDKDSDCEPEEADEEDEDTGGGDCGDEDCPD
ncbi:hypothetical protein FACS1894201_05370 [Bacteroidia bacterium]|nr:hypothetical protein FACS1894201_05370 [Bacteroidia bacterium]